MVAWIHIVEYGSAMKKNLKRAVMQHFVCRVSLSLTGRSGLNKMSYTVVTKTNLLSVTNCHPHSQTVILFYTLNVINSVLIFNKVVIKYCFNKVL